MIKKIIIAFMIILMVSLVFISIFEINSYSGKIEKQKASDMDFSEEITFSATYHPGDEVMPYCMITPSTADEYKSIPLIIYLHGGKEMAGNDSSMLNNKDGIPQILQNYTLEGFNAYVVLPHLTGAWYSNGAWDNEKSQTNIKNLIDKLVEEYNIDTNNIILSGASLGGKGAIYTAVNLEEYFSKLVIISSVYHNDYTKINLPTIGYVGEHDSTISFMNGQFAEHFGAENVYILKGYTHDTVLHGTFLYDANNNNKSDLAEWIFKDITLSPVVSGIELNETYLDLTVGDTSKLDVSPQPTLADISGETITWESTNSSVATVDSTGIVTAIGSGNTTIRATVLGFSAECNVSVAELQISSEKYEINDSYITIQPQIKISDFTSNITTNATNMTIYDNNNAFIEDNETIVSTGMKLKLKNGDSIKDFYIITKGDSNGDGQADLNDILKINKVRLNKITLEEVYALASDVSGDGEINFKDMVKINKYRLKKIEEL